MTRIFDIGPFRLDPEARVLTKSGVPMGVGARGIAVLIALVEHANEYIRKDQLMDAAWPGVVVEESNLAVQIWALRRVLSQAPGGEGWIETLARRGYRFVGPAVERAGSDQGVTGERRHSNLPEPLSPFVGRERELLEIKRLLPGKRLLTIVGVGGIGKTRLAQQLAAEVIDAYRDGLRLVELGPIADPLLVPATVAQVLGLGSTKAVVEAICARLRQHQLLLILDNCEHLLDAAAQLADGVLRSGADTTIVATSREPLHVAGEQTYPLSALSLPERSADIEAVGRSDAVQLFIERARRQLPSFELTRAHASAIAELCIHLDGIPLALELAAARIRTLSVEQINARLDDRFRLLTTGDRRALPHQQTLRATLDWSHDLLAAPERALLRRLAVFPGSFTLEAAAAVAGDDGADETTVVDVLAQLVERSLVVAEQGEAGPRYRLLETMRAYALERLAEAEGTDAIRRRHATYFAVLLDREPSEGLLMTDAEWRIRFAPELDNLHAALEWAQGRSGDRAIGIALASGAGGSWYRDSLYAEGQRRVEAAVAEDGEDLPLRIRARLWSTASSMRNIGQPLHAIEAAERSAELYRRLGDPLGHALALLRIGRMHLFQGRFDESARLFAEALPALEQSGIRRARAIYLREAGSLKMLTGDTAGACTDFEEALAIFQETGADAAAVVILLNLADTTWSLGDLDAALRRHLEAATVLRENPQFAREMLGHCLANLAGVHAERGELDLSLLAAREGLPLCREGGSAWNKLDHLALRAALAGDDRKAAILAGYEDAAFKTRRAKRQPNEVRARDRVQALLGERLAPDEFERLCAQGATLSDDEAMRRAMED
jgi:predicted ATPase/DNA-binding winged helix-turn-helix (wHTH) protein